MAKTGVGLKKCIEGGGAYQSAEEVAKDLHVHVHQNTYIQCSCSVGAAEMNSGCEGWN